MPITNIEVWNSYVEKNDDPYGGCCVNVARKVMELLDEGAAMDPHKLICDADDLVRAGGITGFMAGCVAKMVSQCHSRGDEFKKAWNKGYSVSEDAKGVVNPAILTVRSDEDEE